MRGKRFAINSIASLLETMISIICGLIVPRLILLNYGSKYYGVAVSITQFLSVTFLMRSGIGGASISALYSPLARKDYEEVNAIINATDKFMKKVSAILLCVIIVASIVFPFFVVEDFEWEFTASLFFIIGISVFFENFLGITYSCLIVADQKVYFTSIIRVFCALLNALSIYLLVNYGVEFRVVKLVTTLIYLLYPISIIVFVYHKYPINRKIVPNFLALSQRWDAFWYQSAELVVNNTDVVLLTIFSVLTEVSVYSVYNMILSGLRRIINSLCVGMESAFGEMIAKKEYEILKKRYSMAESMIISLGTIIYTASWILMFDFIRIYTIGVNDVNYYRKKFAIIMIVASFFWNLKKVYESIVRAAGKYKETKVIVIIEPILNIIISVMLVFKYGIVGVALGTMLAVVYRCIFFSVFIRNNIIFVPKSDIVMKLMLSICECVTAMLVSGLFSDVKPDTYLEWGIKGLITVSYCTIIVVIFQCIFRRHDSLNLFRWVRSKI